MERLYEQAKNDSSIIKVLNYLKKFSLNDEVFASKLNNEDKSVGEMMEYINSEAFKLQLNNSSFIDDDQVYGWATHYFDEKEIKFKKISNNRMAAKVSATTAIPTDDKPKIKSKKAKVTIVKAPAPIATKHDIKVKEPKKVKVVAKSESELYEFDLFSLVG